MKCITIDKFTERISELVKKSGLYSITELTHIPFWLEGLGTH